VPSLSARHFELARLMLAHSWPGQGGRRVCKWGQARLGAHLDPPIGERHVRRLVRGLVAAGLVATYRRPPEEGEGGYKGRGRGGNYNVLTCDLAQLALLEAAQASEHMPSSSGQDMAEEVVSPGALERTSPAMSSIRSDPTYSPLGGSSQGGEGSRGEGGADIETNERPAAWQPPGSWTPEHRAARIKLAVARIRAGLDVRTGQPDGLDPATREPRARAYQARCVAEDLAQERARLHSGESPAGYRPFGQDRVDALKRRQAADQERSA
jgi:hypothetical protein